MNFITELKELNTRLAHTEKRVDELEGGEFYNALEAAKNKGLLKDAMEREQAAATGGGMKAPQADDILRARMTVPLQKLLDLLGVETYAEIVPVVEDMRREKREAITTISKQDDRLRALRDQLNTREAEAKGLNRKVVELEKELHNKVNELKARGNKLAKLQDLLQKEEATSSKKHDEGCDIVQLIQDLHMTLCTTDAKNVRIITED